MSLRLASGCHARSLGRFGHAWSDDLQGPWTLPSYWQTPATGENRYVFREIGTANAGMQVKSAAGGNSWIPAIGVSVGVFDGEDAQVRADPSEPMEGGRG